MRQLLPFPSDDVDLPAVYAYPDGPDRWVRANFVATLDGAVTGRDGHSGSINSPIDREVFSLLRALSDVILVGAGTARNEGYRPPVTKKVWRGLRSELGLAEHPTLAVVTRSGDLPPLLAEPRENSGDVLLITCADAPDEAVQRARSTLGPDGVLVIGDGTVDLAEAVWELGARGLRRILCEGGPHLMNDLVNSGSLDELCLTVVPRLVGGTALHLLAGAEVDHRFAPFTLLEAEGDLLGRWVATDRLSHVQGSLPG